MKPIIPPDPYGRDVADAMAANEHGADPFTPSPAERFLMLDRDPSRPRWLLVARLLPADCWPAVIEGNGGNSRYRAWEEATQQVRHQAAEPDVQLTPLSFPTLCWRLVVPDHTMTA